MALEELLAALEAEAAEESARADRAGARRGGPHRRRGPDRGAGDRGGSDPQRRGRARADGGAAARAGSGGGGRGAARRTRGAVRRVAQRASRARCRCFARVLSIAASCGHWCARAWPLCPPRRRCASTRATKRSSREIARRARPRDRGALRRSRCWGASRSRAPTAAAVRNTFEERMANAEPALRILFGEIWSRDARDAPRPPARRGAGGRSVSIVSHSADFVYGNTRLRARKAALLGPAGYRGAARPRSRRRCWKDLRLPPTALTSKPPAPFRPASARSRRSCASTSPVSSRRCAPSTMARRDRSSTCCSRASTCTTCLRCCAGSCAGRRRSACWRPWFRSAASAAALRARSRSQPEPVAAVDRLVAWRLPDPESAACAGRGVARVRAHRGSACAGARARDSTCAESHSRRCTARARPQSRCAT